MSLYLDVCIYHTCFYECAHMSVYTFMLMHVCL